MLAITSTARADPTASLSGQYPSRPADRSAEQVPAWHVSPSAQPKPQLPQLAASVFLSTSQPVLASRSQSAKPAVQDASAQVPLAHAAAPFAKAHP